MKALLAGAIFLGGLAALGHGEDRLVAGFSEAHGEHELAKVLEDCPQLRNVVQRGNPNWNWLVSAFGDESQGFAIRWTHQISPSCVNVTAESSAYPDDDHVSYLRVDHHFRFGPKKGQIRPPEEVLSNLVFELNNVRLGPAKKRIAEAAMAGTLKRADYIQDCAHEEFVADQETAAFYHSTWVPYCQRAHLPFSPRPWYASIPASFEQWVSKFPPTFWYPWGFYGSRFDRLYGQVRPRDHS